MTESYKPAVPAPPVRDLRHTDMRRDSLVLEWDIHDLDKVRYPAVKNWVIERTDEKTTDWRRLASLPPSTRR